MCEIYPGDKIIKCLGFLGCLGKAFYLDKHMKYNKIYIRFYFSSYNKFVQNLLWR